MSVRKGSKIIASAGLINISAVDDVLVDGTSVVTDKVAEIDLTGKQDKLSSANAGTNVSITEVGGVVKINATNSGGTDDFDELTNRPSYNGTVMTHSTNIPEVKTATWDGKQDAISDLTTIRSGAALGATAAQPDTVTSAISTHNADNTAHSDIRSAISGKSTVSVSDTGTSEDEVQYITIDGVEKKLAGGGSAGSGRNIGDIFYTTRNDTALAGAVECNGGTYNTEDYEGDGSIGELLEAGKLDYISLTAYATAISTKGWCDKIGWNGTGTTSFRVPTLTPHIIQKNNIPVDIRVPTDGQFSINNDDTNNAQKVIARGSFPYTVQADGGTTTSNTMYGVADTSDTAQLRVMFQLFNGTTDEAVATVGTVVAQVGELNSHRVIDFQEPTADNNYTWYRKYADGWVEQGGTINTGSDSKTTITFPVAFSLTPQVFIGRITDSGLPSDPVNKRFTGISDVSTTSFSTWGTYGGFGSYWQASGMAAE